MSGAEIAGHGLHTGAPARLRFVKAAGPVRLRSGQVEASVDELVVDSVAGARSTSVRSRDGRLRVRTVEHLFAALGAAAIGDGLILDLDGPEIPLADGGARAFLDALEGLNLAPTGPALAIARTAALRVGDSTYAFRPPSRDGQREVEVEVDFGDPRLAPRAAWQGGVTDFRERVATARTFGFAHELEALLAAGLATHVTPEGVVIIAEDRILSRGASFMADEPARHKLLDLVGDLYAHGGPPSGSLRAVRPGHAATHAAIAQALAEGIVARTPRGPPSQVTPV